MGVYIPNMSKPKRCIEELDYGLLDNPCLFVDEREACLLQRDSKIGEYEENYKTCPLIEIDKETEHHILNLWEYAKDMKVNMEQARKDLTVADLVTCKECKHFHYDKPYVIQGMPILGHEVCDFWGDGCKTNPNGFCSYGERREE